MIKLIYQKTTGEKLDITKIANKLVQKINQSRIVYGGTY